MGVPGAVQITLRSSSQDAAISSWSLPAFVVPMRSISIMMGLDSQDLVFIQSRVADALNIKDNDTVDFYINDIHETWRLQVKIRDGIFSSDILIHDLIYLLEKTGSVSVQMSSAGTEVTMESGAVLHIPSQEMWAGMRTIQIKGSAILSFSGTSGNNPQGPAGYGFNIVTDCANKFDLVQGSGFAGMTNNSNRVEYEGLIDGLKWAFRLDLKRLTIVGNSELIIWLRDGYSEFIVQLASGNIDPQQMVLYELCEKVQELLSPHAEMEIIYQHIPQEENGIADSLANQAIGTRSNVTVCNWPNINNLMREV